LDWNDLKIILAIGRAGTLTGAASALNQNHSTVFRRINTIEEKLDVRFFDRLPNGYALTEAGETAMRSAERVDDEMHSLARELIGQDLRLQGSIRITAAEGVTLKLLGPLLAKFCKLHPLIHIDLVATSSALQLSRREADIALRVTKKPPDTSIGKRVCKFRFCLYASKSYLQENQHVDLVKHDWVMTDDSRDWFPTSVFNKIGRSSANVVLSSNSTMAVVNAAIEGLGIAMLPCFLGDGEKKLHRVIEPTEEMTLDLWLLMHTDLRHTARVKVLMQFLQTSLKSQHSLIEGAKK